jgi:hypothetical protein
MGYKGQGGGFVFVSESQTTNNRGGCQTSGVLSTFEQLLVRGDTVEANFLGRLFC